MAEAVGAGTPPRAGVAGVAQRAALGAGSPLLGRGASAAAAAEGGRAGPTLEGLREAAAEALVAVGELERWVLEGAEGSGAGAGAGAGSRVSRVTRERLVRRAAHRAAAARGQLAALLAGCEILSGHEEGVQARLIDLEGARHRLLRQVTAANEKLREQAELNRRLTRELADRDAALDGRGGELEAARGRAREEALRAAALEARAGEAEEQAEELRAAMVALREENAELRAEAGAALDRRDVADAALSGAERVAAKAQEQVGKHQAGIARLTAENLAFITQAKDLRQELEEARRQRDESRLQDGPWFDRVKADVAAQVEEHMRRAEAAEAELKCLAGQYERRAESREVELGAAHAELAGLRGEAEGLRGELETAKLREQQHQLQLLSAEGARQDLDARVAELEEDGRALLTSARIAQGEIAEREIALQGHQRAAAAEGARAQAAEEALAGCEGRLAAAERALRVQRDVNAEVMRLKQEMEWRLVEAKVSAERDGRLGDAESPGAMPTPSEGGGGEELAVLEQAGRLVGDDGREKAEGEGAELEAPETPRAAAEARPPSAGEPSGPVEVEAVPAETTGAVPSEPTLETGANPTAEPAGEKKAKKKRSRPNPAKRERLKVQAAAAAAISSSGNSAASTPSGSGPAPSPLAQAVNAPPFVPQSPPRALQT